MAPVRVDEPSTSAAPQIPARSIQFIDSHLTKTSEVEQSRGETDDIAEETEPQQRPPEFEGRPRFFEQLPALLESGKTQFGNGTIKSQTWNPSEECTSLPEFLLAFEAIVSRFLSNKVQNRPVSAKVLLDVSVEYAKLVGDKLEATVKAILRTPAVSVTPGQDAEEIASKLCDLIWQRNQNFISQKSGLIVYQVHWGKTTVGSFNPLRGAAYVELPARVRAKKAVVNVKNKDERCFGFAILASKYNHLVLKKTANDPKHYLKYFAVERLDQIQYPVAISQLSEVERTMNIAINVFSFTDDAGEGMYPVYLSQINRKSAINLLYWREHYSWISKFSRLMSSVTKHQGKKHFCMKCLGHFSTENVLLRHEEMCSGDVCQQVMSMAPENSFLRFTNTRYQQRCPFIVYADFECITNPVQLQGQEEPENTDPLDIEPKAAYQVHKPCSVGLLLVSTLDDPTGSTSNHHYEHHFGEDSPTWFLNRLAYIEEQCMSVLLNPQRLVMSAEDTQKFQAAKECYLCRKAFREQEVKVRDHDHVTGKFRGAAHQACNLMLRRQYKIPVFFHNFRGYDGHLIVAALGKDAQKARAANEKARSLRVIGQGLEKYLTLSYGDHIVIKDSLQFMAESLESLATSLLRSGDDKFCLLRKEFAEYAQNPTKWSMLLRKGVYPYDYMDSMDRFTERALPTIESFFNRLRQEPCSSEDYEHASAVWREFGCATMQDYHDLYLKADVLLLADVFEKFRSVCMENYGLDPAHYVSAPHLSWDAMLKSTECKLELLSDPEMYRLLESGLRGGVAMVSKRFAKANNSRLANYDPTKPDVHLMYWDANNLYGWAMSQPLPEGKFRWLENDEFEAIDWTKTRKNCDTVYVLECDLEYPEELHDKHNDYPLAPERLAVDAKMWSKTQQELHMVYTQKDALATGMSSTKLVPNLYSKTRYCIHSRNLKFYLKQGMQLLKVYRAIEFKQSAWMRVYIEKNQNLRAVATSDFEKNFYKLMNNACYGKTCENQRKRTNIQLVTDVDKTQKLLALPQTLSFRVFTPEIAAIELMKPRCIINRPFYVGFTVLEFAKLHMYRFHYDFVKPLWPGKKSQLLFTDTDSLMYEIQEPRLYEKIWQHRDEFDLSDYPKDFFHDATNKAIIGKFKDEAKGKTAEAFVGLRAKMYCWKLSKQQSDNAYTSEEKARAKGIQRAAMRNVRFDDYEQQLRTPHEHKVTNRRIGAHLHRIYTYEYAKKGLCSFDDKRYILEDGISTLAYGHYRVKVDSTRRQRVFTAEDTEPVHTFADAYRRSVVRNIVLEDDEEEDLNGGIVEDNTIANARVRAVLVRPGMDPEQLIWKARTQQLDQVFGEVNPIDMLDLLTFVV